MLYSNWKLVVISGVVVNNSGLLLWVGGWVKNELEIFTHWNGLQD